jgi:SsrA-binding protein
VKPSLNKLISTNKKAKFNFFLEEKYEAGLVLFGSEVKAIRLGKVSIEDSYVILRKGELYLISSYVGTYNQASILNHDPKRARKLLLNSKEVKKITGKALLKGYSVVACSLYFNAKNLIKIEIAIGKGKKLYDKRESIKHRDWERKKSHLLKHGTY